MSEAPEQNGSEQEAAGAGQSADAGSAPSGATGGTHGGGGDGPGDPKVERRREFLTRLTIGLGTASAVTIGWAVTGYVIAPTVRKPVNVWRSVGPVDSFAIGSTTVVSFEDAVTVSWGGEAGRTAAWLRRDGPSAFVCFSVNCTHLGCPVRWEQGSQLFMCPCHGGVYYKDGTVAAGPPPLPLPRYAVRINAGNVEVQTSEIPITRGV